MAVGSEVDVAFSGPMDGNDETVSDIEPLRNITASVLAPWNRANSMVAAANKER